MRRKTRFLLLVLMLAPAFAAPVAATGLQVAPTSLDLPADRASAGLELRNTGEVPLHAQVRVYGWRVEADTDVLSTTDAIAASPPLVEIAPGATQLVRVVRNGAPPAGEAEAAYRILVDELPREGTDARIADGLRFVLRYSIPVFLQPDAAAPTAPVLDTRFETAGGQRRVVVGNGGGGRAQVADLAWVDDDGRRQVIAAGLSGYVLPGSRRGWDLPAGAAGGRVVARINGETSERTLAADPAPR